MILICDENRLVNGQTPLPFPLNCEISSIFLKMYSTLLHIFKRQKTKIGENWSKILQFFERPTFT